MEGIRCNLLWLEVSKVQKMQGNMQSFDDFSKGFDLYPKNLGISMKGFIFVLIY